MDDSYRRYEEAVERAARFERTGDPLNALEWSVVALRFQPGDPVALRHKARAEQEIARLAQGGDAEAVPQLSPEAKERFDKHLLLAETFFANGAAKRATRELEKAGRISPNHPRVAELASRLGIDLSALTAEAGTAGTVSAYVDARPDTESDGTILKRRIAVATALARSGRKDSAKKVLDELAEKFGELPEIAKARSFI